MNQLNAEIQTSQHSSSTSGETRAAVTEAAARTFNLVAHLERQRSFSRDTFGPGARTKGVLDHIRKELAEIEADPQDISEWVDVIILAFDGAWRSGWEPEDIVSALVAKQSKNEGRKWPDWRTAAPDRAIEHDRSHDIPVAYSPIAGAVYANGDTQANREGAAESARCVNLHEELVQVLKGAEKWVDFLYNNGCDGGAVKTHLNEIRAVLRKAGAL